MEVWRRRERTKTRKGGGVIMNRVVNVVWMCLKVSYLQPLSVCVLLLHDFVKMNINIYNYIPINVVEMPDEL